MSKIVTYSKIRIENSNTVVNDSTEQTILDETDDIAGLPDIQGRGNQYSLHQAMLRDETGRVYRELAA